MAIYISKGKIQAIVNEIGLSNSLGDPTTATGDIVYRDANGDVISLPIGTDGTILTSNGTVPYWAEHIDVSCLASVLFSGATLNATINQRYVMDSNSFATVVALPEAPVDYSWVAFSDWKGNFSANNLTINASGSDTIFNGVDTQLVLDTNFQLVTLQYVSGNWSVIGAEAFVDVGGVNGGGLVDITEAKNVTAPNDTVSVVSLTNTAAETNSDIAITPKGTGAFMLQVPDGTSVGGNKRGTNSIDLQFLRDTNTMVASGNNSVVIGAKCTASADYCTAIGYYAAATTSSGAAAFGYSALATGSQSVALGNSDATGDRAMAIGDGAIASGTTSFAVNGSTASATNTVAMVYGAEATGIAALAIGNQAKATATYAIALGRLTDADASASVAIGHYSQTKGVQGRFAYSCGNNSAEGDAQYGLLIFRGSTTTSTADRLTTNGGSGDATTTLTPATGTVLGVTVRVVGTVATASSIGDWEIKAAVKNVGGTVTIVHQTTTALVDEIVVDAVPVLEVISNVCAVKATGKASTTIRWVATAQFAENTYA